LSTELVVDASIAVAWALQDETDPDSEKILTAIQAGQVRLVVSELWLYETRNAVRSAMLRGRTDQEGVAEACRLLLRTSKTVVPASETRAVEALRLSVEMGLSVYDAAYLALARERGADLVTWDKQLLGLSCPGVRVLSPKEFSV
jgi:predicted nucleic acid-binding protein